MKENLGLVSLILMNKEARSLKKKKKFNPFFFSCTLAVGQSLFYFLGFTGGRNWNNIFAKLFFFFFLS
jgi:hypothetical protein